MISTHLLKASFLIHKQRIFILFLHQIPLNSVLYTSFFPQCTEIPQRAMNSNTLLQSRFLLLNSYLFPYIIRYRHRKDCCRTFYILQPTYVGPTVDIRGLSGLQSWAAEPAYVGRKILLDRNR